MSDKTKKNGWLVLAFTLALIGGSVTAVRAGEQDAPGIWIYNKMMNLSIVNMTEYTLNWDDKVWCEGRFCQHPFYDMYNRWCPGVDPYRTSYWQTNTTNMSSALEPLRWGGDMTFTMSSNNQTVNPEYTFIIHFVEQAPANALAGKGCWVSLQKPVPPAANKWYNSSGAMLNGRWCTPIGDTKMHNIMTMASDKFVVSLYSPDNKAVVLVLQQNYSSIWGNDAKDWMGWELDWVDNGESSVPGQ